MAGQAPEEVRVAVEALPLASEAPEAAVEVRERAAWEGTGAPAWADAEEEEAAEAAAVQVADPDNRAASAAEATERAGAEATAP